MTRISKSPEINERIRYLRKELLKIQQGIYAKDLGLTQGGYADLEMGRSTPTPRVLRDISIRDHVSMDWLLQGIEPVFLSFCKEEEIATWMGYILRPENDGSFKQQLIHVLSKLNEDQWQVLADIVQLLLDEQTKKKD